MIYGPAGGACHDFLNLKSRPHPPRSFSEVAAGGRGSPHRLQLCEDMCAATPSLLRLPRLQSASNVCHVHTRQLLHALSLCPCKQVERMRVSPGEGSLLPSFAVSWCSGMLSCCIEGVYLVRGCAYFLNACELGTDFALKHNLLSLPCRLFRTCKYTQICSQQPLQMHTHTHTPPQLSAGAIPCIPQRKQQHLITRGAVGRAARINFCNVT